MEVKEGWVKVTLGELCNTTSGGTPSRKNTHFYTGKIPWVKSGELNHNIIIDTEEHISNEAIKSSSAKIFPENTLLIALYGATIGKLAILGVPATTNQAICGIFPNQAYEIKYLFNYLFHKKRTLVGQGAGGAQPNISQTILKKLPINLPPLPEQRAIVTKIEQLFSKLDKGITSFKSAQKKLEIYRQAVLKKAFEGELTKTWREQQNDLPTADELLQQIQQQRQQHYQQQIADWEKAVKDWEIGKDGRKPTKPRKLKEQPSIKNETLPFSWKWVNLTQITQDMCLGKMLDKKKNEGDFLPYLGNINVRWGEFDLKNLKNMRFQGSETKRYSLNINDLVICEGGEPGRCAIWKSDKEIMIQKALHRVRFFQDLTLSSYIFYYIQFLANTGQLEKYFTGTTIKHLTGKGLEKISLPLCPSQEQTQIVQEIESRLSVCDKLADTLKQQLKKAEALRQSILKKAFEGRLLTDAEIKACQQEADWEPAEQLLARIKAESAKKPKVKPRKK